MRQRKFAASTAILLGLYSPLAVRTGEPKPTTIVDLDMLPVGLKVVHAPNPVRATETGKADRGPKYVWRYKTTVTATGQDVKIVEFGSYFWHDGKWVFGNFTRKPFSPQDFAKWYSCPNANIKKGKAYTDPRNWGSAQELLATKGRWYYIGIDASGRRVKGEAIIEQKAEIDPNRPTDKK